jgi:hypothetical protein
MTNATHTPEQVTEYRATLLSAIDARATHEATKNAENTSMQATLAQLRKSVDHDAIAWVMLASNVNANFINTAERVSNRFNVYSAEKVVNVARAIAKVATLNHYTLAVFKTAIALTKIDSALSHKDAACACSMSVKHTDSKREAVIKSARYAKHVAANTASTQSSSSINALQACNVLTETRDAANVVTYTLNTTSEAYSALVALTQ